MLQLGQLLEKFKNLTNTEKVKKQLVVEIIKNRKIPINIDQVYFSKNTIFIKTKPIIKTEILLQKEEVLKEIKKIPGLVNVSNIQ